jgi:chromosome segregation ATPase
LKNEISRLERIVEEKERYLKSLRDERIKLVSQNETFREENLSLEEQIQKKEEDLLFVEKEIGELTRNKNDLENEVEHKSNVIRERGNKIVEKEQKIREAIEESNRLRLKIDTLQQQHSEAMMEDREMSKKIEILENDINEKENIIMNLRKNKTMTREEIEEEWKKIKKAQMVLIEQQTEKIEFVIHQLTDCILKLLLFVILYAKHPHDSACCFIIAF